MWWKKGKATVCWCRSPEGGEEENKDREAPALLHAVLSVLKKWRKEVDIKMLPEIWVNFCQGDDRKDVSITRAINAWKKREGVGGGKIVDQGMAQQQENI